MPDSDRPAVSATSAPSQKPKNVIFIVVAIAFTLGITLLWVMPPTISYGSPTPVSCRALGPGLPGGVVVDGFPSYWPTFEVINEHLFDQTPLPSDEEFLNAQLGAAEACGQARMNRFTSIVLVSVAGLATLLTTVIVNQRKMLATLRSTRLIP